MTNKKMQKRFKKMERQYSSDTNEASSLIKIIIGVLVIAAIVYVGTAFVTGEISFGEKKTPVQIQYTEILAEQTFKQNNKTYYVMYYDFEGKNKDLLGVLSGELESNNPVYKVDLGNISNKNYLATNEKVNTNPTSLKELKVNNPTLIKIKNKKVTNFVSGINNIKKYVSNN